MAQGQTVIRNIKGIAAAVERQEFSSIANFLEKNQKVGAILFGDTPETQSSLLGLIQVLRNGALDDKLYFINFINDRVSEHLKQSNILPNQPPKRKPEIIRSGEPLADLEESGVRQSKKKTTNLFYRILEVGKNLRNKLTLRKLMVGASSSLAGVALLSQTLSPDVAKTPFTLQLLKAHADAVHATVDMGQNLAPNIQNQVEKIGNNLSKRFHEANEAYQLSQQAILSQYPGSYYNPFLVKQLETDANARQYVAWITQAALEHDINPIHFANQLHRESRQFDPKIVFGKERSSAGALGLAQFMPSTALHDYGLTEDDLRDPRKSIFASAKMMSDLSIEYNGDEGLARIAYNGGRGAVNFVREELGKNQISSKDWLNFMAQRRIDRPTNSVSAWQNQTYKYEKIITGSGWEIDHKKWSRQQQGNGLPEHMIYIGATIAANAGQLSNYQITALSHLPQSDPDIFNEIKTSQDVTRLALNLDFIPPPSSS